MSHFGRKHEDMEGTYDKIMHSTPKYGSREPYDSRVTSYVPGDLRRSSENELPDTRMEQVSRKENVTVRSGASRSVSQHLSSSDVSSARSKELLGAMGDARRYDLNSRRTNGDALVEGDILERGPSKSEMDSSRYTSGGTRDDTRFEGGKKIEHPAVESKPNQLGFQYEDIQSFRERQKIEGERLLLLKGSLSGNIVGPVKKGDSGYSSGIASDLDKSRDNDVFQYSSSVREYKSSRDGGPSYDDRLMRDEMADSKSSGVGSYFHSRFTSHDNQTSRDGGVSHDDRYSRDRLLADAVGKTSESNFNIHSSSNTDYISSSNRDLYDGDRNKLPEDLKSGHKDISTHLHTHHSDSKFSRGIDPGIPHDERFSKTDALVAKYLDSSRHSHKRASDIDLEHQHLSALTEIAEEEKQDEGRRKDEKGVIGEKHHSASGKPMSYLPKDSSYEDLLKKKKQESSLETSEASCVLDKNHDISSQSKFTYGDVTSRIDRRSDYRSKDVPGSSSRMEERNEFPRRLSYDWQDDKKARQQAIDRLLESTRRYSVDSILDKTSHDKKLDDVIGGMTNKDLGSTTSHVERHVQQTKIEGRPAIARQSHVDDTYGKSKVHQRLSHKTSSELEFEGELTRGGNSDRTQTREKYQSEDTSQARYGTPYTSLDHSHYKPRPFVKNADNEPIYAVPIKKSKHPKDSSHPDINHKRDGEIPDQLKPDPPPAYQPNSSRKKPEDDSSEGIYDKLRFKRGSSPPGKREPELHISKHDNRRGSVEGLDEPVYERLYLASNPEMRSPKGRNSPVPMSDHFGLPLEKYNKPVALHGKTKEPAYTDETVRGREIQSAHSEQQHIDQGREADFSDFVTGEHGDVTETTRTSYMQRSFVSRNGEVIKDEVKRHDEVRHGGQNAIQGVGGKGSDAAIPTRIQRYPPAKKEDVDKDVRRLRDTEEKTKDTWKTKGVTPEDHTLDEILKLTGLENTGDVTNYQEHTRRDDVTRVQDDSNFRTKVLRKDINTNVNIVKEISAPKKETKPAGKSAFANLRSKIEALSKSVDELMEYKKKTLLRSYVKEHAERPSTRDVEEQLPKIERYEVKSKRYEPKKIESDQVDYVYKKLDLEELPKRPEHTSVELNIKSLWLSEEQQTAKDIGLYIPKQIILAPENTTVEWWNAATAEDADRFLCIGDWQWWNANTTEGVDHILGIQAINKETGASGAIIAKYQGDENPIEWAWLEASNQPSAAEKRRTLTRAFMIDNETGGGEMRYDISTTDDTGQHLSIGNVEWWNNANTAEGVDHILGVRGSNKETGTILATYDEGTKPTAWTWVQTSHNVPEIRVERSHTLTRSSRDIYVDETDNGKVELLIRVKDEETQDPRYMAIRPGPIEKTIIVHEAVESEMPYTKNVRVEGQEGGGLMVENGLVQMNIRDMTPEARQAWVYIMGIDKSKMKENESVEIPVKVVDRPSASKSTEELYAVPMKKNKNKPLASSRPIKSAQVERKKKMELKKSKESDRKKKESETEKKKRESKQKKLEAEKKKKEEMEKKKKEDKLKLEKKKKEEKEIQKKKRESENLRENEMERKRKEQQKRKQIVSFKKEKVVKEEFPPPVNRSAKPKLRMTKDIYTQDIRRHSDVVDAGMGQRSEQFQRGNSKRMSHVDVSTRQYGSVPDIPGIKSSKSVTKVQRSSVLPNKSGPFAMTGKGVTHKTQDTRPQSARPRMTSYAQNQNARKTEFEERGNLSRKQSPSVKVVQRISITQSGKTRPYSPDQTDSIKHKSGSLQRRSAGSSIAVPLRGGAAKQTNGNVKVISNQNVQGPIAQHIRQTTVQESRSYRTETHITSDDGSVLRSGPNTLVPEIATGQFGQGHYETKLVGAGRVRGGHVGAGHVGVQRIVGGQASSVMLQNIPTESTTDYSHESGIQQLPDGSYEHRDVSQIKRTSWAVEEIPTTRQSKC